MVTGWATLNGSLGPMSNSRAVECYSLTGQAESEDRRPREGRGLTQDPTAWAGAEPGLQQAQMPLFSEELSFIVLPQGPQTPVTPFLCPVTCVTYNR